MAITQRFLNFDQYYKATSGDKIIVNDLKAMTKEDKDNVNNMLMTVYENADAISTKPTCDCGNIVGQYQVGKLCPSCGTKCEEPYSKVKPIVWLKVIDPNIKFINPTFWLMMADIISSATPVDYFRYLCDVKYNPPVELPKQVLSILNMLGGVRNYKNTIDNIENILLHLINLPTYQDREKNKKVRQLLQMYREHKEDIFSNYIPIISKRLFVVEKTTKGQFINLISANIINAVYSWIDICNKDVVTEKRLSSVMATVMSNLADL